VEQLIANLQTATKI